MGSYISVIDLNAVACYRLIQRRSEYGLARRFVQRGPEAALPERR
jgi:hypothetical protein